MSKLEQPNSKERLQHQKESNWKGLRTLLANTKRNIPISLNLIEKQQGHKKTSLVIKRSKKKIAIHRNTLTRETNVASSEDIGLGKEWKRCGQGGTKKSGSGVRVEKETDAKTQT